MAGLETVYAVHNFEAENHDEIAFKVGEPIIVLEKDEEYKDGWWQVWRRPVVLTNALYTWYWQLYVGSERQGRDRPFSNELYVLYHAHKADEKVGISSASTDK